MRSRVRDFVLILGAVPWTLAYWCMVATTGFALLAERIDPTARRGNCWSFGLPRLARGEGYLAVKLLDDVRVLGRFPIPHCIVVAELPQGTELVQTRPVKRRAGRWLPWWSYCFNYKLTRLEVLGKVFRIGG